VHNGANHLVVEPLAIYYIVNTQQKSAKTQGESNQSNYIIREVLFAELSSKPGFFFKLAAEACRSEVLVKVNFFVRFLGELRIPKSSSEIN
jgi:hypothetical protein